MSKEIVQYGVPTTLNEHTQDGKEQSIPFQLAQEKSIVNKEYAQAELTQLRQQAQEHLQARRWTLAIEALEALLDADPQDEEALLDLALPLDRLNRFEELYSVAGRILALHANSAAGLAYK